MRFISQHREPPQDFWEVSVQDDGELIYQAWVKENTSIFFLAEFLAHSGGQPQEVERLVNSLNDPTQWSVSGDEARNSFVEFLVGLVQFLEKEEGEELRRSYEKAYKSIRRFLYEFRAAREFRQGWFRFAVAGQDLIYDAYKAAAEDENKVPERIFLMSLGEEYLEESDDVIRIIEHYKDFRDAISPDDVFSLQSFVNFSKALIQFLEREVAGLGVYTSLIPEIAAFIVKNEEEDFEEQKAYLERIFASRKDVKAKETIFLDIVADIERDHGANSRMMNRVVSRISEYYLNHYDFDKSAEFWQKTGKKWDLVFRSMLSLHKPVRKSWILKVTMGGIALLTFISYLNGSAPESLVSHKLYQTVSTLPLFFLYLVLALGMLAIVVQARRQRLVYSQLVLPRLLGASVVGLTPLLLDDLPWKVGISSSPVNFILIGLIMYVASFVYIFIEVYNASKLVKGKTLDVVFKASCKLFLIAFVETLLVVIIMSTLFYPVVDGVDLTNSNWGIVIHRGGLLSLGFFPSLVFLWTGIALFIGSFVQLLWQDKRITAPL